MTAATVSSVKLCGVAAVAMALLCVATVEAKALPNKLMPGAKPFTIYPGIGRYSIHAEAKNWTEAHKTCSLENGHLAIIDSEEEAAIILEIMDTNSKTDIHIGLHDSFGEGRFVSVLGEAVETLGYQTWAVGYPSGGTAKNYCAIKNAGSGSTATGLYDISSTTLFPFICELPMWDDYDLIPGQGYYKLHNGPRTWKEGWETCRLEGAYLLHFTSTAERDLVVDKYLGDLSSDHIWYGAHHAFANQRFITIFDKPLDKSGFNSWDVGYPGSSLNTNAAFLTLYMDVGKPNDLHLHPSTLTYPFICKHNLHDLP